VGKRASASITKFNRAWTELRPLICDWAGDARMERVKSSPPTYARKLEKGWVTLFAVGNKYGVSEFFGGEFVFSIQAGSRSLPGIDEGMGVHTVRVSEILSAQQAKKAAAIQNQAIAKRRPPSTRGKVSSQH